VGVIDELVLNNHMFARRRDRRHLDVNPSRRLAVLAVLVVVQAVPRDGLSGERGEEQDEENQRQRVVAHEASPPRGAHRPATPMAMK